MDANSTNSTKMPFVTTTANYTTTVATNLSTSTAFFVDKCHHMVAGPPMEIAFFGGILPAVCAIGAVFNIASYFVLRDSRRFKAPTYVYLTSLAIAQFLVLLSEMVSLFTMTFHHNRPYLQLIHAEFTWPMFSFSSTLTQCLLCAITVERYFFLKKRHPRSVVLQDRQQARSINLSLFLGVCLLNWPRMFAYTFDFQLMCFRNRWSFDSGSWFNVYTNIRTVLFNIGSTLILVVFNGLLIAMVLRCRVDDQQHALLFFRLSKRARKRKLQERRLTVSLVLAAMVGGIVEGYTFIFSPVSIGIFWRKMSFWSPFWHRLLLKSGMIILAGQCCANFVIYYMINPIFRHQLYRKTKRAFLRCSRRMNSSIRGNNRSAANQGTVAGSNSDISNASSSMTTSSAPRSNSRSLSAFPLSDLPPLIA